VIKTILYVEDRPMYFKCNVRLLELIGFNVFHFTDADEAAEEIKEGLKYDVALIDLTLLGSRYTGLEVLEISKKYNKNIPAYACSSYKAANPAVFDGYIPKLSFEKKLEDIINK